MAVRKGDLLQGTLDLLVLKVLGAGPNHGYGIAARLHQLSDDVLHVEEGSLYPALYRMEEQGLIEAEWRPTENNRKAKFYTLTRKGRRAAQAELDGWLRLSGAVARVLRAIDAYNAREALVEWLRNMGVTTLHTGHGPGALASGTTIVVKTVGGTINEALIDSGMVAFTLGESVSQNFRSPGTSARSVAMIRTEFLKTQDYLKRKGNKDPEKRPAIDLKMEMLARVLFGQTKVLFTAQKATDIMSALRLAKEFGFKMVLDGAAEAYLVMEEIKKAGIPVILHPTMVRPGGDTRNVSMETAAALQKKGIPFAIQSGYEGYVPKTRLVLYEAAIAASNGLSFQEALASITIGAARIIGVDKRVGSLEPGKDGDVAVFDGDPFEYTSHVCGVIVNGQVVSEICR